MIFVASLAAGLPNAAVLHVRSFTKGVSRESTTYSSNPGHRFCVFRAWSANVLPTGCGRDLNFNR